MKKYRNFQLLLYPDEDLSHMFALNKLKENNYSYCGCVHDKDTFTSDDESVKNGSHSVGDLKKSHTHIILKFQNGRYLNSVADELGIQHNYIQPCEILRNGLLYLIHQGNDDKYQYEPSSVFGTIKYEFDKFTEVRSEGERVLCILDLLDSLPTPTTYRSLLVACCKNGLYSEFRRLGIGASKLLDEHNMDGYLNDVKNALERI